MLFSRLQSPDTLRFDRRGLESEETIPQLLNTQSPLDRAERGLLPRKDLEV
jgi:hypothetical protein